MAKTIEPLIEKLTQGFVLDKQKYPDVEETPYGFIYNVNGKSITDVEGQNLKLFDKKPNPMLKPGFTVADDSGDEISFHDFDTTYKFAKGLIKDWKAK